jgi:hypothetical protein
MNPAAAACVLWLKTFASGKTEGYCLITNFGTFRDGMIAASTAQI